ncbi:hypothetical protein U9M48_023415 [Paspalum notatum var. saurae]|uniref:Uncharacterized protein n=1 Tax=Paspalum notatum var. saurae TaxID=547442 RepID=A0AAQ3WVS3_PASNO
MAMAMAMASSSFVATDPLAHVAFNADATHLVVATSSGIRALSCSPLEHVFSRGGFAGEVKSADLLLAQEGSSSEPEPPLVAVVLGDDTIRYCISQPPPHGQMMDAGNGGGGVVRAIRHVGDHVAVARDYRVTLYQVSRHKAAKLIMDVHTGPNQVGACALALVDGGQVFVLACPTPTVGKVQIWHKGRAAAVRVHAHDLTVACVELSGDGQLLATADDMGSYAFICSTTDGLVRQELRVCCTRAVVSSMAFSFDSKWLAVSSDRAAVHLFNAQWT